MTAPVLKVFFGNGRAFELNMQDITHEESIRQFLNCNTINWITGHIVVSRNSILLSLGLPAIIDDNFKKIYDRGAPMMDISAAMPFEELKKLFTDSQQPIMSGIEKVSNVEALEKIAFSGFHEAYHIGQLGLLRKLIGKEGAIK
ncbi:MAG: hypothetical protein ACLQQ4_14090 [Bacteroidia bacterium]